MTKPRKWICRDEKGNLRDGLEIRTMDDGKTVDEVLLYRRGECVFHLEMMSEQHLWIGLAHGVHTVNIGCGGKDKLWVRAEKDLWKE